jgi:hypothetical protein
MLWMESVPSLRCQKKNVAATIAANTGVVIEYGTLAPSCRPSAAIVPKTATIMTASQYAGRPVFMAAHLQPKRDRQPQDPDGTGDRHAVLPHEVRHRFAHAGGQELEDPEDQRDLGDLDRKRAQA